MSIDDKLENALFILIVTGSLPIANLMLYESSERKLVAKALKAIADLDKVILSYGVE